MKQTLIKSLLVLLIAITGSLQAEAPDCKGPNLCDAHPFFRECGCCKGFDVEIGLLYQQPAFSKSAAALLYSPAYTNLTAGGEYANQTIEYMNQCFDYAIGVTAALGYTMCHDNWTIGASFEWLSADRDFDFNTNNNPTLLIRPIDARLNQIFQGTDFDIDTTSFDSLKYHQVFNIYYLDVVIKKGSYMSENFAFTPFAGVKALWYQDQQVTRFYSASFTDASRASYAKADKSEGAGPMVGFNLEYFFTDNLSLFSDDDIAVLYGNSKTLFAAAIIGINATPDNEDYFYSSLATPNDCQIFLPVRSVLGLKFAKYCYDDKHFIAVKLGYDVRVILSYPDMPRGVAMNGLKASLLWNF